MPFHFVVGNLKIDVASHARKCFDLGAKVVSPTHFWGKGLPMEVQQIS